MVAWGRFGRAPLFGLALAVTVALVAALGGRGTLAASGDGDGGLDGRHTYLVPATAEGDAAIDRASARVAARYGTFSIVTADGSADGLLRLAGADRRDDMGEVQLADGELDPRDERDLSAAAGDALAVVQFVGPTKDPWLERLRATGVTVVTYVAQNGYVVYSPAGSTADLAKLSDQGFVRAITPFTAAAKTAPGIAGSGRVQIAAETLAGAPGSEARRLLATGKELRGPAAYGGTVTGFAAVDASVVGELAADPGVVSVEPWVAPELHDERAAQIVAANLNGPGTAPTGPGYLGFLSAEGFPTSLLPFTVDITDEGIDKGVVPAPAGSHPDFHVSGNPASASRLDYAQEATLDPDARDCGGHGTNVASIATGFNSTAGAANEDAQGFNYGLGIAPRARVGATKIFNCAGNFDVSTSFTALRSTAFAEGARISNNSWGANVGGAYNADAREFDFLVRDARPGQAGNQEMTNVFSAGNAGAGANTIGAPGTAKNVITVGAAESVRPIGATDGCGVSDAGANSAKDIIDFSSRGPTDDGRLKPDVVAPGTHVTGAQPQTGALYNGSGTCNPQFPAGSTKYSLVSGTSQAAPEATGLAALIRDWYQREEGGGTAVPSPALTKAIMVNTATDVAGGSDGAGGTNASVPTQVQGWGRINLGNVVDGTRREFVDQTQRLAASGQQRRRTFRAFDAAEPLKVTLAWTDSPGPTTGNAFVNDLDLVVHAGGSTYRGNVLTGGVSTTGGSADPRNNVENVFLPPGTTGPFSVDVRGTNIAGDGVPGNGDATDQDYALVVSNAAPANRPVLIHDLAATTDLGDGDGSLEPGEEFRLNERLRNVGTASATGIDSTLSPDAPRIGVPASNSGYPNIAANGTGVNSTPFRVRLGTLFECGAPARLRLAVSTTQGNFQVPIAIPTGGQGGAVNQNSNDVPKPIPDLATVESAMNVTATGAVQDVNVRIPSLTHTFDGDLVISLRGPDGTIVPLARNRGSGGDNFTGTVFDDEAATAISSGTAPFTGSFRPESPLAAFDGKSVNGIWTLRIQDQVSGDSGTLNSWGLTRRSSTCN